MYAHFLSLFSFYLTCHDGFQPKELAPLCELMTPESTLCWRDWKLRRVGSLEVLERWSNVWGMKLLWNLSVRQNMAVVRRRVWRLQLVAFRKQCNGWELLVWIFTANFEGRLVYCWLVMESSSSYGRLDTRAKNLSGSLNFSFHGHTAWFPKLQIHTNE